MKDAYGNGAYHAGGRSGAIARATARPRSVVTLS